MAQALAESKGYLGGAVRWLVQQHSPTHFHAPVLLEGYKARLQQRLIRLCSGLDSGSSTADVEGAGWPHCLLTSAATISDTRLRLGSMVGPVHTVRHWQCRGMSHTSSPGHTPTGPWRGSHSQSSRAGPSASGLSHARGDLAQLPGLARRSAGADQRRPARPVRAALKAADGVGDGQLAQGPPASAVVPPRQEPGRRRPRVSLPESGPPL